MPVDLMEGLGERLRASLVLLDVNLPAIALPDGVHCRSFTGAPPPPAASPGLPRLAHAETSFASTASGISWHFLAGHWSG